MKIVIDLSPHGFELSEAASERLAGMKWRGHSDPRAVRTAARLVEQSRADFDLVRVVEDLGPAASWRDSRLTVIEIPDGTKWYLQREDSFGEEIHEAHRVWPVPKP